MAKNMIGVQEDREWFSTAIGSNILKRRIIYYFLDNNLNLFLTLVVTFNRPRIPLRLFQAVLNATHQNLFLYGSDKNGLRYNLSKFGNWVTTLYVLVIFCQDFDKKAWDDNWNTILSDDTIRNWSAWKSLNVLAKRSMFACFEDGSAFSRVSSPSCAWCKLPYPLHETLLS